MAQMFRKLPDGTYRPIERVPGGPPVPSGEVLPDEVVVIDTGCAQIEVAGQWEGAIIRLLPAGFHELLNG